jgi:ribosomal protein S18 acetylase RimI-like enzyme
MSAALREASDKDLATIWPAARAAHLFSTADEFRAWRDLAPWRVRIDERGDAALLVPWRSHMDLLALKALWCSPGRVPRLLDDVRAVARGHGFSRLVSPLLAEEAVRPYLRGGMEVREEIVALRAAPSAITRATPPDGVRLRRASIGDVKGIAAVEAACFDEFWRHEADDIRRELADARLTLACEGRAVLGYTLSGVSQGNVTLGRLAVAPAAQRRGIARALLSDVAEYAERYGAQAVTLCTQGDNAASRGLYAVCGFRQLPGRLVIAVDL